MTHHPATPPQAPTPLLALVLLFSMVPSASSFIEKVPASTLHVSKPTWWLVSRFHFSFAGYWDDKRVNFGPLRVLNDDIVKPRSGFDAHPHRDAEIFSYIVDGELSHADSMGNSETLGRGSVQYMSAGTGVVHSEMNHNWNDPCRFLQIWLLPDRLGHNPQYGSVRFTKEDRHNKLLLILGGSGEVPEWPSVQQPAEVIRLHQDSNVFVSESDAGVEHTFVLGPGRQVYLVCIEGQLAVEASEGESCRQEQLEMRDGAKIVAGSQALQVTLKAGEAGAHWLMIEMQQEDSGVRLY